MRPSRPGHTASRERHLGRGAAVAHGLHCAPPVNQRCVTSVLAACAIALAAPAARADGKLDQAREEIRGEDGEDDDGSWVGELFEAFFEALFDGDDHDAQEPAEAPEPAATPDPIFGFEYSSFPYEHEDEHYLVALDRELAASDLGPTYRDVETAPWSRPRGQLFAGQVALEGGHLDGVSRGGLSARLLTPTSFELDLRAAWLHEPASVVSDASTGRAHAAVRFAQTHALLARIGLGMRYWADAELADAGIDGLLGVDVFPIRPLIVSAELGGGSLGEAPVGNVRLQLGLALQRIELFAGFEWLFIGGVDLSTPFAGARVWL